MNEDAMDAIQRLLAQVMKPSEFDLYGKSLAKQLKKKTGLDFVYLGKGVVKGFKDKNIEALTKANFSPINLKERHWNTPFNPSGKIWVYGNKRQAPLFINFEGNLVMCGMGFPDWQHLTKYLGYEGASCTLECFPGKTRFGIRLGTQRDAMHAMQDGKLKVLKWKPVTPMFGGNDKIYEATSTIQNFKFRISNIYPSAYWNLSIDDME